MVSLLLVGYVSYVHAIQIIQKDAIANWSWKENRTIADCQ